MEGLTVEGESGDEMDYKAARLVEPSIIRKLEKVEVKDIWGRMFIITYFFDQSAGSGDGWVSRRV